MMDHIEAFYKGSVDNLDQDNINANNTTHRGNGVRLTPQVNQTHPKTYAGSACEYSGSNQDYKGRSSAYRLFKNIENYITRNRGGNHGHSTKHHLHRSKQDHQEQREQQRQALVSSSESSQENSSVLTRKCSCQKITNAWTVFQIVHALFSAAALAIAIFLLVNFFRTSPENVDVKDLIPAGVRMPLNSTFLPAAQLPLKNHSIAPEGQVRMDHKAEGVHCVSVVCSDTCMMINQQGIYFVFFSVLGQRSGKAKNDTFAVKALVNKKVVLRSDHTWSKSVQERSTLTNGGIFQLQRQDEITVRVSDTRHLGNASFVGLYMLAHGETWRSMLTGN